MKEFFNELVGIFSETIRECWELEYNVVTRSLITAFVVILMIATLIFVTLIGVLIELPYNMIANAIEDLSGKIKVKFDS